MRAPLLALSIALLLTGCATGPQDRATPLATSRSYAAPFDKVWGALVAEVSADCPVQNVDKASGLITSQQMSFGGSYGGWRTLEIYAYQPKAFLATWTGGTRGSLTFYVSSADPTNTTIRVTARFEAFEDNVSKSWHTWESNGVLENKYLGKVSRAIGL